MNQKPLDAVKRLATRLGLSGTDVRTDEGTIERLVERELGEAPAPGSRNWLEHPPRDLMGIALSGGGIRSATFNLGLLQGLNDLKLLASFDYLSTVSGGGYIGGFWTRWRSRGRGGGELFPAGVDPRAPRDSPPCAIPERREIRHLREFSNFLAPRIGIFSYDTGRMVAAAVSSTIPSLLAALSLLMLALLGWVLFAWRLFGGDAHQPGMLGVTPSGAALAGVTVLVLVLFEASWRKRGEVHSGAWYWIFSMLAAAAAFAAWEALPGSWPALRNAAEGYQRLPVPADSDRALWWLYVLAPCAAWSVGAAALVGLRWTTSRWTTTAGRRLIRAAADRVQSRMLLLVALWLVLSLLWYAGVILEHRLGTNSARNVTGVAGATALLGALFAKVQELFGRKPNVKLGATLRARIAPLLPQILAYATIGMIVLLLVALIAAADQAAPAGGAGLLGFDNPLWLLAAVAAGITGAALLLLNPNEVGIHAFYKSRLVRAYLGASNHINPHRPEVPRKTEEMPGDDVDLDAIHPKDAAASGPVRPFHLICCTANDLTPTDPLESLYRGARSATLSRVGCSVGNEWAGWDRYPRSHVPTLGAAMTASGAAFNSMMGSKSVKFGPAVTFLMAAFNLRLGLWLPHPTRMRRKWYERLLVGLPFYKELLGAARADGRDVHLSDGGHFENMAVYELIRRHCRVILASDCGADPTVSFEDLGNLVRRVREDFGVEIRIDLSALKPGPDGLSRQHMVAGDIDYPDGDTGVLLLFKPTMVGDEPADVTQYDTRNPVFPHETTGDQFYDEAQWEAYRRLGEHSARTAFARVVQGLDPESRADRLEIFARARREWLPPPAGFHERQPRICDRLAELDDLLRSPGCATLLGEVFKEIPELDGQPVQVVVPGVVGPNGRIPPRSGPQPAPPPGARLPDPDELAPTLQVIRRALLVMAEIYEGEDLERNCGHPLYLGLMNYFARWAYAPLFRMWWPLLKAMYPQPFTRFVERHYGLADRLRSDPPGERLSLVSGAGSGFAAHCWLRQHGAWPADREVIAYALPLRYREQYVYTVQAALLFARREGDTLLWSTDDLYVPPGLWGTGIGGALLRALGAGRAPQQAPFTRLVVRTETDPHSGAAGRKAAADQMQLYRAADFRDLYLDPNGNTHHGTQPFPMPDEWRSCTRECVHWAMRAVKHAEVGSARP